jgi:hypothetical protein
MSRTVRRLAIAAGILVALLVLAALALPYVVSLDAMRARAAAAAESVLHRKVEIGKMRLEIFSGLGAGLEKVAVLNHPGFESPALVSADRVSFKVAFWPLLSRRIEVRKVVLDGVTVAIERGPDGALDIDDFLSAAKRDSAPASQAAAAALLVSRIEIVRSRVLFVDRKVAPGRTVTLAVEGLSGDVTDVGPDRPARIDLAARFLADSGRNLALKGAFGPPPPDKPLSRTPLEASLDAKGLALSRLAPYFAAFQGPDPGTLSVKGRVAGRLLGGLALSGNAAIDPAGPGARVPSVDGTFAMNLDWEKGTLVIERSLVEISAVPVAVEGSIVDLRGSPRFALHVATPGAAAIDDFTGLPGIAGRLPESVRLSGRVRLDARIEGPSSDLETRGTLDAAPFAVLFEAKPFLETPSAQATFASRGKGPWTGKVAARSGKLRELPLENLLTAWTWKGGALTTSSSAAVFGGKLGVEVTADFARPESEYRIALGLDGVRAEPLIDSMTSVHGVFSGSLSGKLSLVSRGLGWDAIAKTGVGVGRLSVTEADLKTVGLMPEVARSLAAVGRVAGFQVPASLESTRFSTLATTLRLADGRLATPDLTLSGRDVSASADGSVGLDKTLTYEGRVVLAPSVVRSFGTAGKYIADSQGRLSLPFRVSGSVSAPRVSIDESVVLDLGRRVLAREAQERVGGTAGKILGGVLEGESGGERKTNPLDLLQQLLRAPEPTPSPTPR